MRPNSGAGRRYLALGASGIVALSLAACGGDDPETPGTGETEGGGTATGELVFAGSAEPVVIDGAWVSDGESIRVIRQIFEGLVTTEAGGTDIQPALATEWTTTDDGLEWTFSLQDGVTFHDDTPFNAEAVCFNFDRWYNFEGPIAQSASSSYYYQTVFGGFAENDPAYAESLGESLYESCEATDDTTAVITLTRPSSTFLTALSLPAFSIASPTALEEFGADDVGGDGEAPTFDGTYGYEHPTGTGPYAFTEWERGVRVVLTANAAYWGENQPSVETLIFVAIADGPARRTALETGEIDGYDLVDPADATALEDAGFTLLQRPAFNVGYIGFNSSIPPLDNPDVRKAVAYAVNKENLLSTKYPEGAQVATQFQPPELFGWSDSVEEYAYDPAMAEQLLADSGVANPTIEFWYPTDVSRPYMPDPEGNFELIKADLEAVGFTVNSQSAPWNPDYLAANQAGTQQMYLLGWTGDFGDPDNFIGTFFQTQQAQWGFNEPEIFDALDAAEAETDEDTRVGLYAEINQMIMEFVPGVPYVHTQPAIAFRAGIDGYEPSPVNNEDFALVTVTE